MRYKPDVWILFAETHDFYPGKDYIRINKETSLEINRKYKERVIKRVWGVYVLDANGKNEALNKAYEGAKKYYASQGYVVDIDQIDKMNPDKPKSYVEFCGGSYPLITVEEDTPKKGD